MTIRERVKAQIIVDYTHREMKNHMSGKVSLKVLVKLWLSSLSDLPSPPVQYMIQICPDDQKNSLDLPASEFRDTHARAF